MNNSEEFPGKSGSSTPLSNSTSPQRPRKPLPQAPIEELTEDLTEPSSQALQEQPTAPTNKPALPLKKPTGKAPIPPSKRRTSVSSDEVTEPLLPQRSSMHSTEPDEPLRPSAPSKGAKPPEPFHQSSRAAAIPQSQVQPTTQPALHATTSRDSGSLTQSTSPRTNHFAKGPRVSSPHSQSPALTTKTSVSTLGKQTVMGTRSSKGTQPEEKVAEKKGPAKYISKNLHPLERVKRREDAQSESLKKLGTKEHTFYKALAEIRSALKHYHEDSDRMNAFKTLLPDPQKKPESPYLSSDLSDDVESPQKRSSGEAHSGDGHSTSTSGVSPSNDQSGAKHLDALAPASGSGSSNDSSPEHSKKQPEKNNNLAAAPLNLEAQVINPALAHPLTLAPLYFLFKPSEIESIKAENDLVNKSELLLPLTRLISALRQLQGKFKGLDLLFNPITQLCEYYSNAQKKLLGAASAEQRSEILRDTACATIFSGNKVSFIEIEGSLARKLLCIDSDGNEIRENADGNRAVVLMPDNVMKPNHKGLFIKPGTENAIQSLYAQVPQDEDKPTGTPATLIVISGVAINQNFNQNHLGDRVEYLNGRPTVRNSVQCGKRVFGMSLLNALRGLGAFGNWKNAISEAELITHLRTLETLYKQNPENIKDINKWPEPLLLHSGRLGYGLAPMTTAFEDDIFYVEIVNGQLNYAVKNHGIKKGSISAQELPCIAGLKEPVDFEQLKPLMKNILNLTAERGHTKRPYAELPDNFKAIRALPNFSPETAPTELPKVLFRLNFRNFLSAFKANLIADPTDLTPGNVFLSWNEGDNEFYLVCIDGDEVFEFPITCNSGTRRINSKNILFMFPHLLDQPLSEKEIDEFLEFAPLEEELFFCSELYKKNQGWTDRIAEDVLTDTDRFVPQNQRDNEEGNQPAHKVARPQRGDIESKPMMLDIPLMMHHKRHPMHLATRQCIAARVKEAQMNNTPVTLRDLAQSAKPATALFYQTQCEPLVQPEVNYAESILTGFRKVTSNTPTFEELFLNAERDILPALKEHYPTRKYSTDDKANALKDYHRLAKEKGLKSIDDLCKEVRFDVLGDLSLYDILAEHRHTPGDHTNPEDLRPIPKGIATFVETLQGSSVPTETNDILNILEILGEHFPSIDFKCRWLPESARPALIHEAIGKAMPGALKFLMKGYPNLAARNAAGETVLHTLMRKHRDATPKKVFETLKICLQSPTCDAELENANHCTPLMVFIDAMDTKDPDYAIQMIKLLKQHNVNLNQRTNFKRKNKQHQNGPGTALDFAIDSNNVSAFIALIHQGAANLVDTAAAIRFVNHNKGDAKFDEAVEILKVQHPPFAYDWAIQMLTTEKPDAMHPEMCKIRGSKNELRYLEKSVYDELIKNGTINNVNSVADGVHVVIPLALPNKNKQDQKNKPVLWAKFYPEFPGLQRLVEILFEFFGCPCTYSELWRIDSADGKESFPLLLVTDVDGESLFDVLNDSTKSAELFAELDMDHYTLLSAILIKVAQEDGHAKQFKVVRMPNNPPGKRLRIVPVDFDRSFVTTFIEKILLLKDITFLLPAFYKKAYSPQAIDTLICANGKRLPKQGLTDAEAEMLIRENVAKLYDFWTSEGLKIEDQHLRLFPRDDSLAQGCTRTGSEMIEENNKKPLATHFGGVLDRIDTVEEQQANKMKPIAERKKGQSLLVRAAAAVKSKMGRAHNITTIGCPLEKRIPIILFERQVQISLFLYKTSGAPTSGNNLFRAIRRDAQMCYQSVVLARPFDNPNQHYRTLTEGHTDKKARDEVPRTLSQQGDVLRIVSQALSTKYRANDDETFEDFHAAVVFYKANQRRVLTKAKAVNAISIGDTTALQACNSELDKESYVNSLKWVRGNKDNRSVLNTIIAQDIHFSELRLIGCDVLTWNDLRKILRVCSHLETLNLQGCSGLNNAVNTNNLFQLLADYCPSVKTVILSETEIARIEYDGSDLPLLSTLIIRKCIGLKSLRIVNSGVEKLDLEGCTELKSLTYEYGSKEAMRRPLAEERPLYHLNIRGCTNIPGDDISALLERAPFLSEFLHANNQPFKARSFAWFAMQQNRFNAGTFFALIQNGVLNLWGLPFTDQDLLQFREWLCRANAPKITEFVVRSPCTFSRLAIFEFIVKVPSIVRVVYQGPFLDARSRDMHKWGIGLKHPITRILSLPNGMIGGFTDRVSQKSMKNSAVLYNFRMPDDSFKYLSDASEFDKHAEAKWLDKPHALPEGADLKGVDVMPNGLLLLSMQEDKNFSYLLTLDHVTHERVALDVPEVNSFAGELCMINDKTFALQSDQLYLIHKTEIGWRIQHTLYGCNVSHAPISNGHDLLAYCWDEGKHRNLSIIDIHTGECVLNMRLNDMTIKVLRFIDAERLVFFDGHYYSVLNVNTLKIIALKPYKDTEGKTARLWSCDITDTRFAWVTVLPNRQLLLGGGMHCETIDFHSLNRFTHSMLGLSPTSACLITHLGDGILLFDRDSFLAQQTQRFFIIDLKYRLAHQQGYACSRDLHSPGRLNITTPSQVVPNKILDIDGRTSESDNGFRWQDKMAAGEPTSTTFYDLIFAFFEKYDAVCEALCKDEGQKPFVTFDDNVIHIDGLSDEEMNDLPGLLAQLWQHQPSMASTHRSLSFVATQTRVPSLSAVASKKSAPVFVEEDADAEDAEMLMYK